MIYRTDVNGILLKISDLLDNFSKNQKIGLFLAAMTAIIILFSLFGTMKVNKRLLVISISINLACIILLFTNVLAEFNVIILTIGLLNLLVIAWAFCYGNPFEQ